MYCLINRSNDQGIARCEKENILMQYARENDLLNNKRLLRGNDEGHEYLTQAVLIPVNGKIFGKIIDSRDGKTYKTVLMPDGNWWLSENLNFSEFGVAGIAGAGRLYTVNEATLACIAGCHVPTQYGTTSGEWSDLFKAIPGGTGGGQHVKSDSGWLLNGLDTYGFNIKPTGTQTRDYSHSSWYSIYDIESAHFVGPYSGPNSNGTAWFPSNTYAVSLAGSVNKETMRGAIRLIVDEGNVAENVVYVKPL